MNKNLPPIPKIPLKLVMPKKEEDTKCAPSLEFENGSCYPLDLLVDMAEAYNKFAQQKGKNDKIVLNPKEKKERKKKKRKYINGRQRCVVKN